MKLWQAWNSYRRFQKLPPRERNIVFYSETHQDWHHLQPLIEFLIERLSRTVCHITSEQAAPMPSGPRAGLHVFRIRPGAVCIWLFQAIKADVMVLTMLDLQNFQLKRSIHPVRYAYVFHSMGSTHMVDHENSYDHYDSLLCTGPHHVAEIRRREQLKGLPPKHLFAYGYPRLERLVALAASHSREASGTTTALLAPTWGEHSILHVCGASLIATLLESDLLICDWSAMAIEYALGLGKPVLFVDVPPRVRNPTYTDLGLEPMELRIRRELGTVLPLDRLAEAPQRVAELLRGAAAFRVRSASLRDEWVFNFGHSVELGAREIARMADERAGSGASGAPR